MEIYKIKNKDCELEVYGGSIKSVKVIIGSNKYEILGYDPNKYVSTFIMAPWANRVKNGKFNSNKGSFDLSSSNPFNIKHAIHGTVMFSEWNLDQINNNSVTISASLSDPWPYKGLVTLTLSLKNKSLLQELSIINQDSEIMPFSMGWHPWFKRYLGKEGLKVIFDAKYKWETFEGIPTSNKINTPEISEALDGFSPKPGTLDECYRINDRSNIYLKWPELTLRIRSSLECGHLMVYTPSGPLSNLLCVEPQTATINCFQLNDDSIEDTGILFLSPNNKHTIFTEWSWG